MKMKMSWVAALATVATIALAGCANTPIGSKDYGVGNTRTPGSVQYGQVMEVRSVHVHEEGRFGRRGEVGATVGGIAGTILGSQVGDGSGRRLAQVAGAGIGAAVGSRVDQVAARQAAYEVQVKLDGGRALVITQGTDQGFQAGQRVRVIRHGGTYRITQ